MSLILAVAQAYAFGRPCLSSRELLHLRINACMQVGF